MAMKQTGRGESAREPKQGTVRKVHTRENQPGIPMAFFIVLVKVADPCDWDDYEQNVED